MRADGLQMQFLSWISLNGGDESGKQHRFIIFFSQKIFCSAKLNIPVKNQILLHTLLSKTKSI
jgi:hypothetical protein